MVQEKEVTERKSIVFLSSSFVNLAKLFAESFREFDVFLVLDRRFPFEIEDLDNFYTYYYDKSKLFYKNKSAYFDNLGVFCKQFSPDVIICNNYTKLLPNSFVDFFKFVSPHTSIINIHHADLREVDEKGGKKYVGLQADIQQMLAEQKIISTIHLIEDEKMDEGKILDCSHPTDLKELKQKGFLHKPEEIINLRIRNVVLSYHERTKVLGVLHHVIENLVK
jgi:folate-dependent phosphoribosylglycinamide formyltransferase PurN